MEKSVTQLNAKILDSYQKIGGINNIDGSNLPSKSAIAQICEDLLQLISVRDLSRTDVEAAYEGDPSSTSFDEIIVGYPCIEAIAIQRIALEEKKTR